MLDLEELPVYERMGKCRSTPSRMGRTNHEKVRRICTKKKYFGSEEEAKTFRRHLKVVKKEDFDETRIYECPVCQGFHMSSVRVPK